MKCKLKSVSANRVTGQAYNPSNRFESQEVKTEQWREREEDVKVGRGEGEKEAERAGRSAGRQGKKYG